MANDNRPRYARIGFVVLLGALATAGALVYLGGFERGDMQYLVESYYDNPVSGLSVGSSVNVRGVKVRALRTSPSPTCRGYGCSLCWTCAVWGTGCAPRRTSCAA